MRAAAHDVHLAALVIHRIAVPREAAALEPEADQLPGDAALLLRPERVVAGEGRALVELHDPAEPGLERRDGVVDLVAVERVAHLEPQRVARAESDRLGAGRGERLPERHGVALAAVELEAVLAGVAGAGDEALRAGDLARRRSGSSAMSPSGDGGERLQQRLGAAVPAPRAGRSRRRCP